MCPRKSSSGGTSVFGLGLSALTGPALSFDTRRRPTETPYAIKNRVPSPRIGDSRALLSLRAAPQTFGRQVPDLSDGQLWWKAAGAAALLLCLLWLIAYGIPMAAI